MKRFLRSVLRNVSVMRHENEHIQKHPDKIFGEARSAKLITQFF